MAKAKAKGKKPPSRNKKRPRTKTAKHWVVVEGQARPATLVTKRIYCKTCRDCKGHGPYQYLVWREGKKLRWQYLGKAP